MAERGSGIFTIAPDRPFLEVLARAVLRGFPCAGHEPPDALALARWTILVPTRRAARELENTFFRLRGGEGVLLPKIRPIGDIDEDLLGGDDALADAAIQPAISRTGQQLMLIDLIDEWAAGEPATRLAQEIAQAPHQAHALAMSLAEFLDGIEAENIDVARIMELYAIENARHAEAILRLLEVARSAYPARLSAAGLLSPPHRRTLVLEREAHRLAQGRPVAPIIAAGSTGTIEATRTLLKAIAGLPNGAVILPGLDRDMDDPSWIAVGPTHPQFALKQLLASLAVARTDVSELDGAPASRSWLAGELMRPADTSHLWRASLAGTEATVAAAMAGVDLVETRNIAEEALTVALMLRESLETPDRTSCLVTPDRQLARQVKAELARWSVAVDDSAGEPLVRSRGAALLDLLIDAVQNDFDGPSLAALMRHPDATFGTDPATARRAASLIELALLRTGQGAPDAAQLSHAVLAAMNAKDRRHPVLDAMTGADWNNAVDHAARISASLAPLRDASAGRLSDHIGRLRAACAAIAGERFAEGQAGALLSETLDMLTADSEHLQHCDFARAAAIIRHWLRAVPLRLPQAAGARIAILGLLEARLMRPGLMILAGLNEGVWPGVPDPGPWINRTMRSTIEMSQPEREIGQTAHDFVQAFGNRDVRLVWSRRAGDAPATPSRWILRLQMILKQAGLSDKGDRSWPEIARRMVTPAIVTPCVRPRPKPPVPARPRQLSVTRIETLIRDPYAIYARHVLRLVPVDPISAIPDPARRGIIFHAAIGAFLQRHPDTLPPDMEGILLACGRQEFESLRDYPSLSGFWWPRFVRIAGWMARKEPELRSGVKQVAAELSGEARLAVMGEEFRLTCRADRIDIFDSGAARIIDYKTGAVPSGPQVQSGLAPQLTLQAAILARGGFAALGARQTSQLLYIRLSGGEPPGELKPPKLDSDVMTLAENHWDGLMRLLTAYADPARPYLPRSAMMRDDEEGDYDHLSRYREWTLSGGQP